MVAASKPTSSLSMKPHLLYTERTLGTLAADLGCFPFDNEAYPPLSHCCALLNGIRSLIGVGRRVCPLALSVLYPHSSTRNAAPKCISERTSYHGVWLAFHSYPQLIRAFFNTHRFGPPRDFTHASTWSWVDHLRFGSSACNLWSPYSDLVSLRLRSRRT